MYIYKKKEKNYKNKLIKYNKKCNFHKVNKSKSKYYFGNRKFIYYKAMSHDPLHPHTFTVWLADLSRGSNGCPWVFKGLPPAEAGDNDADWSVDAEEVTAEAVTTSCCRSGWPPVGREAISSILTLPYPPLRYTRSCYTISPTISK